MVYLAMTDPASVLFHPLNRIVSVERGTTVLDAVRKAGIQFESICGGKGECNKCKVIHVRGKCDAGSPLSTKGLSPYEIAHHYCRACQTRVLGDCEFVIPVESRIDSPRILLSYTIPPHHHDPAVKKYLVLQDAEPAIPLPGHRSLKLANYTGIRPQMTRTQQEQLVNAGTLQTVTVSTTAGYPDIVRIEDGDTTSSCYGIALDIGTTTVAGVLIDLGTGKVCSEASGLNLQITHGEELLTRIGVARKSEGREQLRESAVRSANEVISRLVAGANISNDAVCDVCLAGNTVMQYLFLGRDPSLLEIANTEVPRAPVTLRARDAGLHVNPDAWVYCLPAVSRFVGGDAVGDVVASGMHRSGDISLLIDLGTNGEVILGNRDWLASVSCASGPAFEGAGITCGMRAMAGAVDHVTIDPVSCAVTCTTIENATSRGICGSGLIDAAAAMVAAGILDFSGRFVEGRPGVREGPDGLEFVLVPKEMTATGRDIVINRPDLLYLMDTKAAACGAVGVLLKKYRLTVQDIRHVYLAGGFGEYAGREELTRFGILPKFPQAAFHAIGNGSLSGATAALLSQEKREELTRVARRMVYIDLLVDADFIEEYTAALYIPGKPEYFPD